jgi:hypothetical protein
VRPESSEVKVSGPRSSGVAAGLAKGDQAAGPQPGLKLTDFDELEPSDREVFPAWWE